MRTSGTIECSIRTAASIPFRGINFLIVFGDGILMIDTRQTRQDHARGRPFVVKTTTSEPTGRLEAG